MKNIFKISSLLLSLVFVLNSCTDESKFNNPATHHLDNGAFVRFTELPPTDFDPTTAQNINFDYEVYDPKGNVARYDLSVTVNIASTGATVHAENFITLESFPSNISFTSASLAAALGVDVADFGAGDFYQFNATTTRTDGVQFTGYEPTFDSDTGTIGLGNSDGTLLANYESAMRFNYILACPMPATYFVGDYNIDIVSSTAPFAPIFGSITEVTFEAKNVYQRTMDVTYLADLAVGNGDIPFEITFLCGNAYSTPDQESGLACGGTIFLSNGGNTAYNDGVFDDDNEIIINVLEDYPAGSPCGASGNTILRFTRIN